MLPSHTTAHASSPSPPTRLVVADDDSDMRRLMARTLEARGYEVETVPNGQALLRLLADGNPADVVISDVQMPGMDGMEALARLRSRGLQVPVILVTAYPSPPMEDRAAALGAVEVLQKPFPLHRLHHLVDQTVAECS